MHNKIPLFQILVLFILLSLIMVACNVAPPSVDISPTSTPVKKTPTPGPTNTPEPTATKVDPNRPPDATGTDLEGNPTKIEKGETLTWFPIQYGSDAKEGRKGHWAENQMENGKPIFLFDNELYSNNASYLVSTLPFEQYKQNDISQLQIDYTIRHPDQKNEFGIGAKFSSLSHSSQIFNEMRRRFFNRSSTDSKIYSSEEQGIFRTAIVDGSASILVGKDMWFFSKGIREVVVDCDKAKNDTSFMRTTSGDVEFYWKYYIEDGKLIVLIGTTEEQQLPPDQMRVMATASVWEILLNINPMPNTIADFSTSGVKAGFMSQIGGENSNEGATTNFLEFDFDE